MGKKNIGGAVLDDLKALPKKLLKPYYKNGKLNANKVAIDGIPFIIIFYVINKYVQAAVMSDGGDMLDKCVKAFSLIFQVKPYFAPSLKLMPLICGIGAGVAFKLFMNARKKNAKQFRHGEEYGSAKWGTDKDFEPYTDPVKWNNIPLTATEWLRMTRPEHPKYDRNKNILIVGGSGAGKTRGFVKPSLMQMQCSYVVTDPKGTVLEEVGTMLKRGAWDLDEKGNKIPKVGKDGNVIKTKSGKVLKANHTSQRYRLEDNITKTYPKQIAVLTEKISGYKADIELFKNRKEELAARMEPVIADSGKEKEPFEIRVGNRVYTDRKEAGTALIDMCRNIRSISTPVKVGEYMGFQLSATFEPFQKVFDLNIKGAISHHIDIGADAVGNMTRIANALAGMETKLAKTEDQLKAVQSQLESAKAEVGKPFEKEQELAEKLDRLSELNALLNMDESGESEKEDVIEESEHEDIEGDGYGEVPRDSEGDTISTPEAPVHDGMARGHSEDEKEEKRMCEQGECSHVRSEKSIFDRISDKKQQAEEHKAMLPRPQTMKKEESL